MKYIVIGLSNSGIVKFTDEVKNIVSAHQLFSGGRRHYQLVKNLLPDNHQWIDIKGDLTVLFQVLKVQKRPVVVFASGDPLFYGIANTIQKLDPESILQVYPAFNSIQLLCHRVNISYQNICNASVHGRPWQELDKLLIQQQSMIGVLTDEIKSPGKIADRLLEYGFDNYEMVVGEDLEGSNEKVSRLSLDRAALVSFASLNCLLLIRKYQRHRDFGLKDNTFLTLPGRPNMITKWQVRLCTLSLLDLYNRSVLWDIGFCTGSISIEAKRQFPDLTIYAFEKNEGCSNLFELNTRTHSTPGITKIMGDFLALHVDELDLPDAVFIGGHGSKQREMCFKIDKYLKPKGVVVMNTVTEESKILFKEIFTELNYSLKDKTSIKVDTNNTIGLLSAQKL